MVITATELKANVGRYLNRAAAENIHVTRNGKIIATISSPARDKQSILDGLAGIAAANPLTLEQAREERLARQ
ncbi:MAG: type II toxin-antitoxin system prevent-host-death family antitoxin [Oscillospiraceae bacterium]|nr:type II toxin-antitoxin system prevent-host-death family antitoxin [Oscillospiraceae bacterium]